MPSPCKIVRRQDNAVIVCRLATEGGRPPHGTLLVPVGVGTCIEQACHAQGGGGIR